MRDDAWLESTSQSVPRPAAAGLAWSLMMAADEIAAALAEMLDDEGITLRQSAALKVLQTNPAISYTDLARACGITKQSMQMIVRHLEQRGAVQRTGPPGSGHTARLYITEVGDAVLTKVQAALEAVTARLSDALTEKDLSMLSSMLTAVSSSMSARDAATGSGSTVTSAKRATMREGLLH